MGEINRPTPSPSKPVRFSRLSTAPSTSKPAPTHLSSDTGALVLRQLLDDSRVLNWVDAHFEDLRTQDQITHPLPELLRTQIVLLAQGWTHAADADALRQDPVLRLAVSERKGQAPLRTADGNRPQGLASQPTLSRLLEQASTASNREVLEEAVLRSARSRCRLLEGRMKYEELAVDMDALPMAGARAPGGGRIQRLLPRLGVPSSAHRLGADRRLFSAPCCGRATCTPTRAPQRLSASAWTGFSRTWPGASSCASTRPR